MKKIIGILFAMIMCVSLFVACGDDDSTDNSQNGNETPHTHTVAEAVRENVVDATCTAAGSYDEVVYCSSCNAEISRETKSIEKVAHTEVVLEAVEPTCTETGLTAGKKCSVCDEVIEAQTVVEKIAHNYVDGACSACGTEESKHEHVFVDCKCECGEEYVMSYEEYAAAELDSFVIVETYVQAKQGWWYNTEKSTDVGTFYMQSPDGAQRKNTMLLQ